ncbi:MAG: MBL fold metallo-hydrolase [Desulfobacteraceae bacterium]|nr:MBL fold metallo-hydrolase [Desulfobacteraceae bacterium]
MKEIINNIYHVGDNECSVYLVDTKSEQGLVLIDAGMDLKMIQQIESNGLNFSNIGHCILTHCHIDHIGICFDLQQHLPHIKFYAHELDAIPIEEKGHDQRTAASWYGVRYSPVKLDQTFTGEKTVLSIGEYNFHCIHTPGHTPGSISILVETHGKKVVFGQDLHGPFNTDFGSDLNDYQASMDTLLDLNADILCEGHFGIFQPADKVKQYIKFHKKQNQP